MADKKPRDQFTILMDRKISNYLLLNNNNLNFVDSGQEAVDESECMSRSMGRYMHFFTE